MRVDAIGAEFEVIPDSLERLACIVERGKRRSPLESEFKQDAFKVGGCVSDVWLVPEHRDGRCFFRLEADSPLVEGIGGLLCDSCSGLTPDEILNLDALSFLDNLKIRRHISPTRIGGIGLIWERMQRFAQSIPTT